MIGNALIVENLAIFLLTVLNPIKKMIESASNAGKQAIYLQAAQKEETTLGNVTTVGRVAIYQEIARRAMGTIIDVAAKEETIEGMTDETIEEMIGEAAVVTGEDPGIRILDPEPLIEDPQLQFMNLGIQRI